MCLEMLGQVLEIRTADHKTSKSDSTHVLDRTAIVNVDGVARLVSLAVLDLEDTNVGPGDWILSHTGLALRVLDEADARRLQEERKEMYASLSALAPLQGGQLRNDGDS